MSRPSVESLQELAHIPNEGILSIAAEGVSLATGYEYDYTFIFEHPHGQYIKIDTKQRSDFLEQGTEEEAQTALIGLTQATRRISGGAFNVHPFYGAVWGTKLTPVAPGFFTKFEDADRNLTTMLYLTDVGNKFDDSFTQEALGINTTIIGPSPQTDRFFRYLDAVAKAPNPNQAHRDQAIQNELGDLWDAEFAEFNRSPRFWQRGRIPKAMEMNPRNIANLLSKLGQQGLLTEVAVTRVHTEEEKQAALSA